MVLKVLKFDSGLWPLRVVVAAGAAIYSQRYWISLPARIVILSASGKFRYTAYLRQS